MMVLFLALFSLSIHAEEVRPTNACRELANIDYMLIKPKANCPITLKFYEHFKKVQAQSIRLCNKNLDFVRPFEDETSEEKNTCRLTEPMSIDESIIFRKALTKSKRKLESLLSAEDLENQIDQMMKEKECENEMDHIFNYRKKAFSLVNQSTSYSENIADCVVNKIDKFTSGEY